VAGTARGSTRRSTWPAVALSAPALLYLLVFFAVPLFTLLRTALSTPVGNVFVPEYDLTWEFGNFVDALRTYRGQFTRSLSFAAVATVLSLLLAYPLAYVIAFRAGRWKNLLLGLVILPFFITFLVRTLAWKTILSDGGAVVGVLGAIGLLPPSGRLLATPWGVIGGLVYNFLPFMLLPLYVSLERIDPRLIEASRDLYASGRRAFTSVVLPLSVPGLFAGSLLTFIPASGDFINARYLGSANETMAGTVIHDQFLITKDYPLAAALSFVLMLLIVIGVLLYTRLLGTEDLQ
jgi:spermidine/putrescine transport system permease protein